MSEDCDIVIGKMKASNFLSIGPELEFDFSSRGKMNFVYGENKDVPGERNGCGKTVIFGEALMFAMFGKLCRDINNEHIAHRQMPKSTPVSVTLEMTVMNIPYRLESGMEMPGCKSYFKLFRIHPGSDDEDLTRASISETRKFFEKEIIKTNFDMFKNSIFLSASDSANFFKLKKAPKREFAETMFNLLVFSKMLKLVRTDSNALDKEISIARNNITKLKTDEEKYAEHLENHVKERDNNKARIDKEMEQTERDLASYKKQLEQHESTADEYAGYRDALIKIDSARTKINAVKTVSIKDVEHRAENIKKHQEILDMVCEDCKPVIKDKKMSADEALLRKADDMVSKCDDALEKLKVGEADILSKVDSLKDAKDAVEKANFSIRMCSGKISNLQTYSDGLKKELEEVMSDESPFSKLLDDCRGELASEEKRLLSMLKQRKYLDALEIVVSDEGAKKYIVNDLINIQNSRVRKYLDELGALFTCVFDGSFNCEFLTDSGPCTYHNFSKGEMGRIDVSVLFAFRDLLLNLGNLRCNIIILDEFLDCGLDTYAVNSLVKILKNSISGPGKSVYLISHRECFSEEDFDSFIEVQKRGGFTYLRPIS